MNTAKTVIFTSGDDFFKQLSIEYIKHTRGFFILAPSGVGKTYFIDRQYIKQWIDGDYLWPATMADISDDEWEYDFNTVMEINNRCDVITDQARKQGFWIIGASNNWLKPDAIVIPDWDTHKKFIMKRENSVYDGGAKEHDFDALIKHRDWILKWKNIGVPCFDSVQEATRYLENIEN